MGIKDTKTPFKCVTEDTNNMDIIAKNQGELQDMVKILVDNGRKYGMEINVDKSQVTTVSWNNESLQIESGIRELKRVYHFKYL